MLLRISAYSRDCNSIEVESINGEQPDLCQQTNGYVPRGLGIGADDSLELTIDIETGMVIGWDAQAVKLRIAELLKPDEEDGAD